MAGVKLLFGLSLVFTLVCVAQMYNFAPPTCDTIEEHNQMWPDSDPRNFWVCLPAGYPQISNCSVGSGFVNTDDFYGCVDFSYWPCNTKFGKPQCTGEALLRPTPSVDPANFWICPAQGEAVELPCMPGKGFVSNATHFGCIDWVGWSCTNQQVYLPN